VAGHHSAAESVTIRTIKMQNIAKKWEAGNHGCSMVVAATRVADDLMEIVKKLRTYVEDKASEPLSEVEDYLDERDFKVLKKVFRALYP
jgi:hypothetical protein